MRRSEVGRGAWTLAALLVLAAGLRAASAEDEVVRLTVDEPAAEAYVGREFTVSGSTVDASGAGAVPVVRVQGVAASVDGTRFRATVRAERDGVLRVRVVAALPGLPATVVERPVRVDGTAPSLVADASAGSGAASGEVTVEGEVRDVSPVVLRVNGRPVPLESDGVFELTYVLPEQGELVLDFVAEDAAGNRSTLRRVLRSGAPGAAPAADDAPSSPSPAAPGTPPAPPAPSADPVRRAVDGALAWLAAHQSHDGGWSSAGFGRWCDRTQLPAGQEGPGGAGKPQYDVGVTGLALLAFLRAGHHHRSAGPYAAVVADGLGWLRRAQDAEGCIGARSTSHYVYNHLIAARALVEACVASPSAPLRTSAQRAIDFVVRARNPKGAWRYGVQPGDSDTSVTGWAAGVLLAARGPHAGWPASVSPFEVDDAAIDAAVAWAKRMTDPETGRVGYQQRGTGPARPTELVDKFPAAQSESMTAVALAVRLGAGEPLEPSADLRRGVDLCLALLPAWATDDGSVDLYYWYYATEALGRVGGEARARWNRALHDALLPRQHGGSTPCGWTGSWDPVDPWGPDGGRVYATAVAALCLLASAESPAAPASRSPSAAARPAARDEDGEAVAALRRRGHEYARAWAGVLARCPKCSGDGRWYGQTCPQCDGRGRVYDRSAFLKAFEFMVSPSARATRGFREGLERTWAAVQRGESPSLVFREYAIEDVRLEDATHGVVTIRDKARDAREETRWVLAPDSAGRPTWWRFTEGPDGAWPRR